MKKPVHYIVLHCTATPSETVIEHIKEYWKKEKQFIHPGYHYIINRSGTTQTLLLEELKDEKQRGGSKRSVHISYLSGVDANNNILPTPNEEQLNSLYQKLVELKGRYPKAIILGHFDNVSMERQNAKYMVQEWLQKNMQNFLIAA